MPITYEIIMFLGIILVLLFIILFKFLPSKGTIGEKRVAAKLKRLPEDKYSVINNLLINNNGYTSQIDHIVVSVYGIFVIETKTYHGQIYGAQQSENWTQNIYGNKYQFRNPIFQNYGHIRGLRAVLNEYKHVPLISVIVFSDRADLRVSTDVPVIYRSQLLKFIKDYNVPVINELEVRRISRLLLASNKDSKEARKQHVRSVRSKVAKREATIAAGICPRCGGNLVLRKGKYSSFYGCSNYPRCRFIYSKGK